MTYNKEKAYDYENGFMLTSDVRRLGKILAHYEIYKKIANLPGDIVELGVFKGNSIMQFASFRELLENEHSRKIVGFDIFGKFPGGGKVPSYQAIRDLWKNGTSNLSMNLCQKTKLKHISQTRVSAI